MGWRGKLWKEIRFYLKWGAIVALLAGCFYALVLYRQLDEQLRREVESRLAQCFPKLKVRVYSAQFVAGEGIRVRGLQVFDPTAGQDSKLLAEIDEVFLAGPMDYQSLLAKQVPLQRVLVRRPRIRLVHLPEGGWNIEKIFPIPQGMGEPVPVQIENGTAEILDLRRDPATRIALRDVQLTAVPAKRQQQGRLETSWQLRGTMTGDFVRRIAVEGTINSGAPGVRLVGQVDSLEVCPELNAALPLEVASNLETVRSLRAQVSLNFQLFLVSQGNWQILYDVAGQLNQGRLDDPRLPHPVADIRASFWCRNSGIEVQNLCATMGPTMIQVSTAKRHGWAADAPFSLQATLLNLQIDPAFLPLLPAVVQNEWPKYFPEGVANLRVQVSSDGQGIDLRVTADVKDASFAYHKFPYRLQGVTGRLELTPERLTIRLTARVGEQSVDIRGDVLTPLVAPKSQISISGQGIALDNRLTDAILNTRTQQTIRSLQIQGKADFWLSMWQDEPRGKLHRHLEMTVNRCSVCYKLFPYPISGISGRIIMRDDAWSFQELKGVNGLAQITADGTLLPSQEGTVLTVRFQGRQVRLDATLRDAFLKEETRRTWEEFRPDGLIDVDGVLSYSSAQAMKLEFQARPSDSYLSLEPASFPYRLEAVRGTLLYRDGEMFVKGFQAFHGNTAIQADVTCELLPQHGWQLIFDNLWLDRVTIDRALLMALPESLSKALSQLNVQGPLAIRGRFAIGRSGEPVPSALQAAADINGPVVSNRSGFFATWNLIFILVENRVGISTPLENINGKVFWDGQFAQNRLTSRGVFDLDAITFLGVPAIHVRGPFSLEDGLLLLGRTVTQSRLSGAAGQESQGIEQVMAEVFSGQVRAGGWIRLSPQLEFDLVGSLVNANFQELAGVYHPVENENARGKLDAAIRIRGRGGDVQGLNGYGHFQLREADIYELPVMLAVLRILGLSRPDTPAFSESSGQFRIAGPHVYLDTITFQGEMFHLTGQGEVDLEGHLALVLRAMLGKREIQIPVIKEVFRGASEQIVLVHVGGTVQEPIVRRESFPGVNQALQRFQNRMGAWGQGWENPF